MPFQKGNQHGRHTNHATNMPSETHLQTLRQMRWIQKDGISLRVSSHEADQYIVAGWKEGRPGPSAETRQKQAEAQRQRTDRTPSTPLSKLNSWYKCRYNRTLQDYEDVLAAQGGHCRLCPAVNSGKKRLCWDHDHACCPGLKSCGECVRGLLCIACNKFIGHVEEILKMGWIIPEQDTWLDEAINYIIFFRE